MNEHVCAGEARQNVHLMIHCHTIPAGPPAFPFRLLGRALASDTVSALCAPTHARCSRLQGQSWTDPGNGSHSGLMIYRSSALYFLRYFTVAFDRAVAQRTG